MDWTRSANGEQFLPSCCADDLGTGRKAQERKAQTETQNRTVEKKRMPPAPTKSSVLVHGTKWDVCSQFDMQSISKGYLKTSLFLHKSERERDS